MTNRNPCLHSEVTCLNQHELIRKYRCSACGGVMMCGCDESFGRRFLAHQLSEGCELDTQRRVPVTHGFVEGCCSECRGLPADPAPAASIPGRTSKIKRYYWRELFFAARKAQAEWDDHHPDVSSEEQRAAHDLIEKQVLADIKLRHAAAPKYTFAELSHATVIERYDVEIDALSANYATQGGKGAQIIQGDKVISPEAFARRHYEVTGWTVMEVESVPFHALFGVMMWLLIQDLFPVSTNGTDLRL